MRISAPEIRHIGEDTPIRLCCVLLIHREGWEAHKTVFRNELGAWVCIQRQAVGGVVIEMDIARIDS